MPKRKASGTKSKSKMSKNARTGDEVSQSATTTKSDKKKIKNQQQFTILEDGHVDFVYNPDSDDNEDARGKKERKQRIYLILTPAGTTDKTSKRRLIFTKTRLEEDEGPHIVRIENMANNGNSNEASIINRDTVKILGQFAVGKYAILCDSVSPGGSLSLRPKIHFVYILQNSKEKKDMRRKLNGQNSFTIEIHVYEISEQDVLAMFRENVWLYARPERLVFDQGVELKFTQNNEDLVKQHAQFLSSHSVPNLKEYSELWQKINDHFKSTPKYQNLALLGVSEQDLLQTERRLGNITLPDDIRNAVRIHNGRRKFGFGLCYRSPTTDLLPLDERHPYESEESCNELFAQVIQNEVEDPMKEDLREHLKVYNDEESVKTNEFKELKTELLVIGEGMDDYCEQYLLGLRTGTIYLQILNLPEWNKIGTFKDWVQIGLENKNYLEEEDDNNDD